MSHFKVPFQFVAPSGILRNQTLVVQAKSADDARAKAVEILQGQHEHFTTGNITVWKQ